MYEEKYCSKCVHNTEKEKGYNECPILGLHLFYNYDQQGKSAVAKKVNVILETLIPEDEDGFAEQCSMFIEGTPSDEEYLRKLQFAEKPVFGNA